MCHVVEARMIRLIDRAQYFLSFFSLQRHTRANLFNRFFSSRLIIGIFVHSVFPPESFLKIAYVEINMMSLTIGRSERKITDKYI